MLKIILYWVFGKIILGYFSVYKSQIREWLVGNCLRFHLYNKCNFSQVWVARSRLLSTFFPVEYWELGGSCADYLPTKFLAVAMSFRNANPPCVRDAISDREVSLTVCTAGNNKRMALLSSSFRFHFVDLLTSACLFLRI